MSKEKKKRIDFIRSFHLEHLICNNLSEFLVKLRKQSQSRT